jgi:oxygen-independent coproporphyrinogen-3 oxidase
MPEFSSLYVHFPFCESKCHYCDFYSLGREKTRPGEPELFLKALHKEAELWTATGRIDPQLETIFFGGGTPSMTPSSDMRWALEPLWKKVGLACDYEWTMEANPSSTSLEAMREYRAMGVNRISMGVQSLREDLLKDLGRVHSPEEAEKALDAIFSAGFTNVSVDLLCGVPNQKLSDVEAALKRLTAFPITHLSCYLLTLPPHHRMYPKLPDENTQLEHLLLIDRWMTSQGFEHYEISNFCRPGKKARHNMNYWQGASYLGLGPSAHSFSQVEKKRWKNCSSLHLYADRLLKEERLPAEQAEDLTPDQLELEKWMLALRLDEGFPEEWLKTEAKKARARTFTEKGLMEPHPQMPNRLRLTARGFALSDPIISAMA